MVRSYCGRLVPAACGGSYLLLICRWRGRRSCVLDISAQQQEEDNVSRVQAAPYLYQPFALLHPAPHAVRPGWIWAGPDPAAPAPHSVHTKQKYGTEQHAG